MDSKLSGTYRIDIQAPALRQLTVSFAVGCGIIVSVSILAPLLEKVSWRCRYTTVTAGIGIWGLWAVRLDAKESNSTHSAPLHLPYVHIMSLFAGAHVCLLSCPIYCIICWKSYSWYPPELCLQRSLSFPKAELSFTAEIEKHMVTGFSVLELHFVSRGHVFGAFVLCLFRMQRICAATRSLKVVLLRSEVILSLCLYVLNKYNACYMLNRSN